MAARGVNQRRQLSKESLAKRIDDWVEATGKNPRGVGVDVSDLMDMTRHLATGWRRVLKVDPTDPECASKTVDELAYMRAILVAEAEAHASAAARVMEEVIAHLLRKKAKARKR